MAKAIASSDNVVVIRIQSLGLGNIFFQYAAAKALANASDADILFDISGCAVSSQMIGEQKQITNQQIIDHLSMYNLKFSVATPEQIRKLRGLPFRSGKWSNRLQRLVHKMGFLPGSFVKEQCIHQFQAELLSLATPVYLEGTFINPNYWKGIEDKVRSDISLSIELPEHLKAIGLRMKQECSISIHVRRGDYASNVTNNTYPLYGNDYVKNAVAAIEQCTGPSILYIFSDDPNWARKHIMTDREAVHISGSNIPAWADLELMSSCRHNVIGNSTFSWWAAYRNLNPNKIVVAPRKWRNDAIDTSEILVNGWIAMN